MMMRRMKGEYEGKERGKKGELDKVLFHTSKLYDVSSSNYLLLSAHK